MKNYQIGNHLRFEKSFFRVKKIFYYSLVCTVNQAGLKLFIILDGIFIAVVIFIFESSRKLNRDND
ncbi:MAG: hypothetical protein DWQ05_00030 [Calditrichaeota bacterium]|nr:MAG: hypothetical protein DWQ05_00030 [Calditrichota bacterium]